MADRLSGTISLVPAGGFRLLLFKPIPELMGCHVDKLVELPIPYQWHDSCGRRIYLLNDGVVIFDHSNGSLAEMTRGVPTRKYLAQSTALHETLYTGEYRIDRMYHSDLPKAYCKWEKTKHLHDWND